MSVEVEEAALNFREFQECLVRRGLRGDQHIVSEAHPVLKAASKAVFMGSRRHPCQPDLMEDTKKQASNEKMRKRQAAELRAV